MATTAMDPPFNHAGGCQAFGHFLVAGLENSNTETNSEIQFWDFSGVPEKRPMTIPRPGSGHKHTAGAVGITSFERGTALTKQAKKHMYCTKEVGFDGGTGIFIPSPAGFEVFAVGLYSGDHVTGTTIYVNHFAATDVG
jgi:hypothetical protein